jgi:hypothetical protein
LRGRRFVAFIGQFSEGIADLEQFGFDSLYAVLLFAVFDQ